MDDYIKRRVAINVIANAIIQGESLGMSIAEDILYDVPSEDVQPVIRCKDCKWCVDADGLMCKNEKSWVVATEPSFGCVYGKRKDGDTDG